MAQRREVERSLEIGDDVFSVVYLQPRQVASFDRALEVISARAEQCLLTVIDGDLRAYGLGSEYGIRALLNAIPPLASVRLVDLGVAARPSWLMSSGGPVSNLGAAGLQTAAEPRLLGQPEVIRYVCASSAEPDAASWPIVESVAIRRDFSRLAYLWGMGRPNVDIQRLKSPDYAGFRVAAAGIGRVMGELHDRRVFWIDAHRGQFGFGSGLRPIVFDLDDAQSAWLLYKKPSPGQCATMLVPLLSSFDEDEFEGFIRGYIVERGADGVDVYNCLRFGDETGWMRCFEAEDFRGTVKRVLDQYDGAEEEAFPLNVRTVLAMSYSKLGESERAETVYSEALATYPGDVANIRLNLGAHYFRAGDKESAAEQFREIIRLGHVQRVDSEVVESAVRRLENCGG